jgi:8-oxo-dGTP diphosphatase
MVGVVSAFMVRGGRALLQQRPPGKPCAFRWESPGGKIEGNESHHQALRREIREELGVELGAIPESSLLAQEFEPNVGLGLPAFFMLTFVCLEWTGEPRALEGQGLGWFLPRELRALNLAPANAAGVETLAHTLEELARRGS